MDLQAEASKRAFALEARDDVVTQGDALERGAEHKLARVQNERPAVGDLDQLGQFGLLLFDVDVAVATVAKDAEATIASYVDAGRLNQRLVERIERNAPCRNRGADSTVRENHLAAVWQERGTAGASAVQYAAPCEQSGHRTPLHARGPRGLGARARGLARTRRSQWWRGRRDAA